MGLGWGEVASASRCGLAFSLTHPHTGPAPTAQATGQGEGRVRRGDRRSRHSAEGRGGVTATLKRAGRFPRGQRA